MCMPSEWPEPTVASHVARYWRPGGMFESKPFAGATGTFMLDWVLLLSLEKNLSNKLSG